MQKKKKKKKNIKKEKKKLKKKKNPNILPDHKKLKIHIHMKYICITKCIKFCKKQIHNKFLSNKP